MSVISRVAGTAFALVATMLLESTVAAAQAPKRGGILNYGVTAEPPSYDCHAVSTYAAVHVLAPHYSLLVKIDADNYPKVKPDLAESWTVSPDGLAYTFKLRQGVVFHDGTPLTSKDVAATFDRLRKPPQGVISIRQAAFEDITAVDAPDSATVVFKLKAPDPGFLDTIALPYNCVYSAARLAADPNFPAKNVMGTGPYVFEGHQAGSSWSGRRFDRYFIKDRPLLDGFKALFIKSGTVASALRGGQIDIEFRSVTPAERDSVVQAMKDKIVVQESPWICKVDLMFNTEVKPFDDVRVRQALQMAVDRWGGSESLAKIAIVRPIGGPLRPGYELALPPAELEKLPGFGRDAEKARAEAKRLLAEAGQANLSFKLVNRNVAMPFTPVGVYVVDQFKRIGVTAEHQQLDVKLQKAAISSGQYQVAIDAACADSDDPRILFLQYVSKSRSPRNVTRNDVPEIDGLFDRFKAARAPAEQQPLAAELERKIIAGAYSVPVIWYSRIVAHSSALRGWKVLPTHFANQDLVDVWLDR